MKKWFVLAVVVTVLGMGTLFVGPHFVDWNQYKPILTDAVREQSGFRIEIEGNVDVDLLPAPRITLNKVVILNGSDEKPAATARWARAQFGLHGFIIGSPQLTHLEVVEPVVHHPVLLATRLAKGGDGDNLTATATLENLVISLPKNVTDLVGPNIQIPQLQLTYDADRGGWYFTGTTSGAVLPGFSVSGSARARQSGDTLVTLDALSPGGERSIALEGVINEASSALQGRLSLSQAGIGGSVSPISATGPVTIDFANKTALIDPMDVSFGEIAAEGRASLNWDEKPDLSIDVASSISDFGDAESRRDQFFDRTANLMEQLNGSDFRIKFTSDRARWKGGVVRDLEIGLARTGDPSPMLSVKASLPGDIRAHVSGSFENSHDGPQYDGEFSLAGNNIREALKWAFPQQTPILSTASPERFRQIETSGTFKMDRDRISIHPSSSLLDGEPFSYEFDHVAARDGELGALVASINIANFRAGPSAPSSAREEITAVLSELFTTHKTKISLGAEQIRVGGGTFGKASIAVSTDPDSATGALALNLYGPSALVLSAKADLSIEGSMPVWKGIAKLDAPDPTRSFTEMGIETRLPQAFTRVGPFSVVFNAGGNADGGVYDFSFDGKHAQASLSGNVLIGITSGGPLATITLESGKSSFDELPLSSIDGQITLESPSLLRIDHIAAILATRALAEVSLSGSITRDTNGAYALVSDIVAENVDLKRSIGRIGDLLTVSGSAWVGARIESEADQLTGLLEQYRGNGQIDGRTRITARAISNGVLRLGAMRRLRDWLANRFAGGATTLGTFRISPGRIDFDALKLEARGVNGGGNAVLDLANNVFEAGLAVYERGNGAPYLDVTIDGPISKPDVHVGGRWISGN